MKAILIIALVSVLSGWIITLWIFWKLWRKENKRNYLPINLVIALALTATVSCTPCRNLTGDGYMVWVREGVNKDYSCVENTKEADSYIQQNTGMVLVTDSLIGKRKPYYFFDNGDFEVYVERESSWKSKRHDRNNKR